jgi:hypothetical protein
MSGLLITPDARTRFPASKFSINVWSGRFELTDAKLASPLLCFLAKDHPNYQQE